MKLGQKQRVLQQRATATLALILAGGRGSRLEQLTLWRSKPAVPFGGKFRIIDFALSNCINSNIRRIGVLTQYKAHSLIGHIQRGWSFLRGEFGEFIELLPAQQRIETSWYAGTADAVYQNLDIIRDHKPQYILVLAGDHIYKMDYSAMVAAHVEHGADMTVGCIEVPLEQASAFGVITAAEDGQVTHFDEKPEHPQPFPGQDKLALASMGIYVFNALFLYEQVIKDSGTSHSSHDFGKDIIPSIINKYRVFTYPFHEEGSNKGAYWRDVGTVDAYWEANLELIGVTPVLNLYDNDWPIWTYQTQVPPAKFIFDNEERRGMAVDSMVSGGCIISGGLVRHSLLFSNVKVHSYAKVIDSVVLPDAVIGRHCSLRKVVVEKGCVIPDHTIIGEDPVEDARRFHVSPGGVVLVTPEMLGQTRHHVR